MYQPRKYPVITRKYVLLVLHNMFLILRGTYSKQDQILLLEKAKYILVVFCVYRRSYLRWSPVIVWSSPREKYVLHIPTWYMFCKASTFSSFLISSVVRN